MFYPCVSYKTQRVSGDKEDWSESIEALAQVAQRSCGCPVPGRAQGQAGRGFEHPGLVEGVQGVGIRWSLTSLPTQSLGTEGWGRSQLGSRNVGSLKTLQLTGSRCLQSSSHLPLPTSQVSPCFLPPRLTLCVPPRRARQLSSLPKRLLPGFKSQSKSHLNNTEQISSTAFPPHEYFIRLLGAKPVGGGIKLTARTHGC